MPVTHLAIALLLSGGIADRANVPDASRLEVFPSTVALLGASGRQQLAVGVVSGDGSMQDVTASAAYRVEPPGIASISPTGVVTPQADGEANIIVEAQGRTTSVGLRVREADLTRPTSYRLDVAALLSKAGCNMGACHGNINGKGGFRLSLRGEDPGFDLLALTRDALARRVDPQSPDRSLVLLKPAGLLPHEGGVRFGLGSAEARALRTWIEAGASDDVATAPTVRKLSVFPAERILAAPSLAQQLVVTAEFSDGSTRDVTRQASFDVDDPTRVSVTLDGRVEVAAPAETTVAVRYLGARAVSRLAFLADRPSFVWRELPERNAIDRAVFAKLKALKIHPSPPVDDATILRRAYLDAIGLLPTAEEVRSYVADDDPAKRERMIDRLLRRPEFADFWALKWADLLRNEEKTMGDKGVWVFQRWLRDQIERDLPLDEFARVLVSSIGSNYRNPPSSFHRTNRDPMTAAETVGQVFLGVRLQCARCHNHPFDVWTQNDYYGLAAFFGNVRRKQVNNLRRDQLDSHEINGDEIVYLSGRAGMIQPRSGENLRPTPLHGRPIDDAASANALEELGNWLTRDNSQFARNLANRIWFNLNGRGVVEPVDDFRDSNPPSNPELLDVLTGTLVEEGMRLRPLVAFIMNSTTYSLGSRPEPTNVDDTANFARASVRLLPAEVLLDAISQALGHSGEFPAAPPAARAAQLPGARTGGDFLKAFGKPDRLLTCECERSEATTLAQAFQLINGESIRRKLEAEDNRIGRLLRQGASDETILDDLSMSILSHPPDASTRAASLDYVVGSPDRRKAWEDVAWAMINSKEFLLRH